MSCLLPSKTSWWSTILTQGVLNKAFERHELRNVGWVLSEPLEHGNELVPQELKTVVDLGADFVALCGVDVGVSQDAADSTNKRPNQRTHERANERSFPSEYSLALSLPLTLAPSLTSSLAPSLPPSVISPARLGQPLRATRGAPWQEWC